MHPFLFLIAILACSIGSAHALDASQRSDVLGTHNAVRAEASTLTPPPIGPLIVMTYDPTLESSAQAYSDRCNFQHSGAPGVGENLYASSRGTESTAVSAIRAWASERPLFNYSADALVVDGRTWTEAGHYIQMVWNTTTRVGCGFASCPVVANAGSSIITEYWVCHYAPPGNVLISSNPFRFQKPYLSSLSSSSSTPSTPTAASVRTAAVTNPGTATRTGGAATLRPGPGLVNVVILVLPYLLAATVANLW
ncbi:PR-1-like protein [Gonapodya prolifera JEL478]|uniref:PR-1-like protein n=1 Tax=Gonapodya prolifera (strain JEL478) TaxID=1344416 RepID=A0A139AV72_GONPJ|nr:PR-1-like protein [Gonapodya prolifera JEL478]|eukprot:KXS20631.1 PR-1-like protein [Gonapodya prolifera JEL478]